MNTNSLRVALLSILGVFIVTACTPNAPPLVFRNGLVITATESDPIPNGVVVVEDGLITAVGPESDITIPKGADFIDLDGQTTIMPGLIDARSSDLLDLLTIEDGKIKSIPLEVYLKPILKNGVTTLRATGWYWENMQNDSISLRTALESHGNTVPLILISGTSLAHVESSAYTIYYSHDTVGVGTAEEAHQITEKIIDLGADQVNFVMTVGPAMFDPPEARKPVLTLEQLNAIVETAHEQDTLVVGQALLPEEAFIAIEAGVDQLTAWPALTEPMSDELLTAIVNHSVPVLSGFSVGTPFEGDVRRFLDAGGTLVFGTFAPHSGATPTNEFRLMELHGMTPMEMIKSATVNAANALEIGELVGTLEVGKQADIIVVDGNLLEDNFLNTIGNVVYVVKNGDLVVKPE